MDCQVTTTTTTDFVVYVVFKPLVSHTAVFVSPRNACPVPWGGGLRDEIKMAVWEATKPLPKHISASFRSIMCSKQRRALHSEESVYYYSYYHQYFLKHFSKRASRIERYTSVDDCWSRKSPASKDSQIRHVFHLTYAALIDKLIQQVKLNRCHGCSKTEQKVPF